MTEEALEALQPRTKSCTFSKTTTWPFWGGLSSFQSESEKVIGVPVLTGGISSIGYVTAYPLSRNTPATAALILVLPCFSIPDFSKNVFPWYPTAEAQNRQNLHGQYHFYAMCQFPFKGTETNII